jgi:hypothetical protein
MAVEFCARSTGSRAQSRLIGFRPKDKQFVHIGTKTTRERERERERDGNRRE